MGESNNVIKLAFTGSTKLTKQAMEEILKLDKYKILSLFGLSDDKLGGKVNSVNMDSFCEENGIILDKSGNWENFRSLCAQQNIDMIITLGDSRIIPKKIIYNFEVIGNHGAILPYVQGGASLVWGRMFNLGHWGISIMRIEERVDSGEILKTKEFWYTPHTTEAGFVRMADRLTVEALLEVLNGNTEPVNNRKWNISVSKHTDSYRVSEIYNYCIENDLCIYLPPRTPKDSTIEEEWPPEFIKNFKIANNAPYPRWKKQC